MPEDGRVTSGRKKTEDLEEPLPLFLEVFDIVRARPGRRTQRSVERMERLARRRSPVSADANRAAGQRGDLAEPPPVLDLVVERDRDRGPLVGLLRERSVLHPFWELSGGANEGEGDEANGEGDGSRKGTGPEDPGVTTDELYRRMRVFTEGSQWPEEGPTPDRGRRPPPPSPFRRLRSLLDLQRCDVRRIYKKVYKTDEESPSPHLDNGRRAQFFAAAELREIRSLQADASAMGIRRGADDGRQPGEDEDSGEDDRRRLLARARLTLAEQYAKVAHWSARASANIAVFGNLSKLDELVLTPASLFVNVSLSLLSIGSLTFLTSGLTSGISWFNTALTWFVALAVFLGLLIRPPMLHLPWARFQWLNEHRYLPRTQRDGGRDVDHRTRGIDVLNLLTKEERGWIGPDGRGPEPPATHRLIVNAFLDDLHQTYGATTARHRHGPRHKRGQRPVLVVDRARADLVTTYLLRLIEDERLRRALPDPLLLVQIRGRDENPLAGNPVDPDRYPLFPEGVNAKTELPRPVSRWRRERHAAGVLGTERLITLCVYEDSDVRRANRMRPTYDWVPDRGSLVRRGVTMVVVGAIAAAIIPALVHRLYPCESQGMFPPPGIVRVGQECVGVTDGETVFHPRLALVTGLIHEQNSRINDDDEYVTIVHVAELSTLGSNDLTLAGVQGELHGVVDAQERHNESPGTRPKVKILLANTGHAWARSETTADEIVRLAENKSLGMDRPIGAVGFGHSVQANNEIIRDLSDIHLPMVGTTATFDDIAFHHNEYPSYLFFPIAPSNSRIAREAALWAREGVPGTIESPDGGTFDATLEPAGRAVAVANAATGEEYGPHLAQTFMAEFVALGGQAWTGGSTGAVAQGVLEYQVTRDEGASIQDRVRELCEDPPDLIYFAGRSDDFAAFHGALGEDGKCPDTSIDVLAGDDVAKYVTDHPDSLRAASDYPVYYTPLAASGAWGAQTGQEERDFHLRMARVIAKHYGEDGEKVEDEEEGDTPQGDQEDEAEEQRENLPSVAHAAMGHDALRTMIKALDLDPTVTEPDSDVALASVSPPPSPAPEFLADDDAYEAARADFLGNIQAGEWTGASGHIQFNETVKGNWNNDRMVQLVLAGPVGPEGEHQHVLAVCGRMSAENWGRGPCAEDE